LVHLSIIPGPYDSLGPSIAAWARDTNVVA
jgi:hypothetical protein